MIMTKSVTSCKNWSSKY